MKKNFLLFILLVLVAAPSFATRFLVQTGVAGDAIWRAAATDEVLVNLSSPAQSLDTFYNTTNSGVAATPNEIWLAKGSYVLTDTLETKKFLNLYGGFIGTETTIDQRVKLANGNPWDFVNESIIKGGNAAIKGHMINTTAPLTCIYDGLTITGALKGTMVIRPGVEVRNTKIINNANDGNGTAGILCNSGGDVTDCLFEGNATTLKNTSQGVALHTGSPSTIKGCLFTKNKGLTVGGGTLRSQGKFLTVIENCIFDGNDHAKNGSALYLQHNAAGALFPVVKNCLIINNKTKGAVYTNGGATFNHCTIANNAAGAIYVGSRKIGNTIENCVFHGKGGLSFAAPATGVTVEPATLSTVRNSAFASMFDKPAVVIDTFSITGNRGTNDEATKKFYPHFIKPATALDSIGDYRFTYKSALLDKAFDETDAVAAVTTDILGVPRKQGGKSDIGCYELPYYTATATAADANGTVSPATQTVAEGVEVTVTATANANYAFNAWSAAGAKIEKAAATYTFPLVANIDLTATFSAATTINTTDNAINVYAQAGMLYVDGAKGMLSVYTLDGAMAASQWIENNATVALPIGLYIVKIEGEKGLSTYKITIK